MGWLEILPLLRRLLPLLSRAVPMLESTLAARSSARSESSSEALRAEVLQLGSGTSSIQSTLKQHSAQLAQISGDLQQTRLDSAAARDALELRLATITRWMKVAVVLSSLALVAVIALVVSLLRCGHAGL